MKFYSRIATHSAFLLPTIGVGLTESFWIEVGWLNIAVGISFGDAS